MKKFDIFCSILEYILAFMFIRGGISVILTAEAQVLPGVFAFLVGEVAIVLYGLLFLSTGLLLLYGKWLKQRRIHRFALFFMFLTCIYVLVLAIVINGLGSGLLLTLAVGLTAGGLWVHWKFKTEYIDTQKLQESVSELRAEIDEEE